MSVTFQQVLETVDSGARRLTRTALDGWHREDPFISMIHFLLVAI